MVLNKLIKNDKPKGIVIESVEKVLGESEKILKKFYQINIVLKHLLCLFLQTKQ